ncbi:ECF-type sigma factor [Wenzhouxiangella limi]|uniref:Sigma-70 family RNA polymerase sigma factor n=1 Tax=Wenzhouxiangella limi TaxID=2707351 RepID=A0A845VAA1_9GAMM|nr:sigma-70 family RNA polymerase sigma factor [Wenzhouxiangella limi]
MNEQTLQSLDGEVTRLLSSLRETPETMDQLLPLVYEDMRRIARTQQARLGTSPTLQTTELVHEAFLKLRQSEGQPIRNSTHFKRLSYLAIRQLIVDHARAKQAAKRGAGQAQATLHEDLMAEAPGDEETVLRIDEALDRLAAANPRQAEVVIARFFGGYKAEEIAGLLETSVRTVQRDWERARAWLLVDLEA